MIKMTRKPPLFNAFATAAACIAMPLAAHAANPGSAEFEAVYTHNDNVSFASKSSDIKEDSVLTLGATGNYTWQLSEKTAFKASAGVQYNAYDKYSDITNVRVGGAGEFEFRPRRGFTAPWYSLLGRFYIAEYNIDNRDGSTLELRALAGKRFTDRITARTLLLWCTGCSAPTTAATTPTA